MREDLKEPGWEVIDWIQVVQDRDWWRVLVWKVP
jgi:hypothetical protein